MAAPRRNRSKPTDPAFEKTRSKIQATQLVKRLEHHALGTKDDQGRKVKLDSTQVSAIKILLDKSIPNLQAIELTGQDGGPVEVADVSGLDLARRVAFMLTKAQRETESGLENQK